MVRTAASCVAVVWGMSVMPARADSQFIQLGDLPGGAFQSTATDVSADGSVVIGRGVNAGNNDEAYRWESGVMTGLGDLSGGIFESYAYGVSADGSVIVGRGTSSSGDEAYRWESGVMTGLGDLPGGAFESIASGVSADGSVVVGRSIGTSGTEAYRWESGVMTGLGDLPGGSIFSQAQAVSADGSVIVGSGRSASGGEAFRWESGVMTGLGDLPGGDYSSIAQGVSGDGSVVVGIGHTASGEEAFRWEAGVMTGLGDLPGGSIRSRAYDTSGDGSVVVGFGTTAIDREAFVWDAAGGMQRLEDVLNSLGGVGIGTFDKLSEAFGVTPDGRTFVGYGFSSGEFEAYRAHISANCASAGGAWGSAGTWSGCFGSAPALDDNAQLTGGSTTISGDVDATNDIVVDAGATLQNQGGLHLMENAVFGGNGTLTVDGTFNNEDGASLTVGTGSTLAINGGGSLDNDGTIENNGAITSADPIIWSGFINGSGSITAPSVDLTTATLNPGNSPGLMVINGDVVFGDINFELADPLGARGVGYDAIDVDGDVTIAGTAVWDLFGFPGALLLSGGESFDLLSYSGTLLSGVPTASLLGNVDVPGDWSFSTSIGGLGSILSLTYNGAGTTLTGVPEPETMALLGVALMGLAGIRQRRRRAAT